MKSFEDLDREELYRSAIEDFAVDVEPEDSAESIRAALLETGITWADYVAQHPEVLPEEPNREQEPDRGNVITTEALNDRPNVAVKERPVVRVKEAPIVNAGDMFLIKMVRDNVLYETRGHRFTQEHPYALVTPEDAQYILEQEDGFRQAFPNELQEFYS